MCLAGETSRRGEAGTGVGDRMEDGGEDDGTVVVLSMAAVTGKVEESNVELDIDLIFAVADAAVSPALCGRC